MQVTETLSDGLKRELKVVIPANELDGRLMTRLNDLKDKVRIAGFRPGKVPVAHLRRVYGRSVMAEVVQETVNETSQKALDDRAERPAFQPKISFSEDEKEIETVLKGQGDLAYGMAFEIMPKFEATDFSKITVTKPVAEIPEEEIEKAVQRIAENNRPFDPKAEGAAAENGDRVTMSFEGFVDGEKFEGGADDNAMLVLGSNSYIPGFEEQLVGAKAGDDLTVKVKFPDEYPAEHLKGKDAEFKVNVKEVAAPGEVKIDDAFAATLGLDSVDKLKEAVRDQMSRELTDASRRKVKRALLDVLDESHSFELPPTLVDQEFESIWQQLEADMKQSGRSFEDEDTTEEKAREEYRKIAERRVRLGLLLADVGEKNDIKVTDDEVNRALMDQIRRFPGQEQMVYDFYRKNPQALAQLRAPIFEEKVVDYILALATVNEEKVSREDLLNDPDDEHDHNHAHHHHHHDHDHHHHDHDHDHHHHHHD